MIRVERAKPAEVHEVKRVLGETWRDTYSALLPAEAIDKLTAQWHTPARLGRDMKNPDVYFGVAKDEDEKILGLVTAAKRAAKHAEETVMVQRLYVLPEAQRRGIGTMLLEAATAALAPVSRLRLQVEEANEQAVAFYRKQGFEAAGHRELEVEGVTLQVMEMEKQLSGT